MEARSRGGRSPRCRLVRVVVTVAVLVATAGATDSMAMPDAPRFEAMAGAGTGMARGVGEWYRNPGGMPLVDDAQLTINWADLTIDRRLRGLAVGGTYRGFAAGLSFTRHSADVDLYGPGGDSGGTLTFRDDLMAMVAGVDIARLLSYSNSVQLGLGLTSKFLRQSSDEDIFGEPESEFELDLGFLAAYETVIGAADGSGGHDTRAVISCGGRVQNLRNAWPYGNLLGERSAGAGIAGEIFLPPLDSWPEMGRLLRVAVAFDASVKGGHATLDEIRYPVGGEATVFEMLTLRGGLAYQKDTPTMKAYGAGLRYEHRGLEGRFDWARTRAFGFLGDWTNRWGLLIGVSPRALGLE